LAQGRNGALLNRGAGVLVRVLLALGRDGVELFWHRLSRLDVALLEDHGCIAKDEINGACDGAFTVELAVGVCVQGVLVPIEEATVEDGPI